MKKNNPALIFRAGLILPLLRQNGQFINSPFTCLFFRQAIRYNACTFLLWLILFHHNMDIVSIFSIVSIENMETRLTKLLTQHK